MDVAHIAKLANLTISPDEEKKLGQQFSETLTVVEQMNELDTSRVQPSSQVTGLINVLRADEIDKERILPQKLALSQAAQTHQGYFVVPSVFDVK